MAFSVSTSTTTTVCLCSFSSSNNQISSSSPTTSPFKPLKFPPFWPWQKVKMGSQSVSPMGFGTWAWGNQFLWGYKESMDADLQKTFNLALENGINLFDTADSYGTGKLNGQSEKLLGKFIREFPGFRLFWVLFIYAIFGSLNDRRHLCGLLLAFSGKQTRDIVIATKFAAYPWRLTPGQFVNACKASLERLQIEQIGIGQLHWSTANYAPLQELALWDGLLAMD